MSRENQASRLFFLKTPTLLILEDGIIVLTLIFVIREYKLQDLCENHV